MLNVAFEVAEPRLAALARGGWLMNASEGAYDSSVAGLMRVGPRGAMPGISKLVRVDVRDVIVRDGVAVLTMRWQATGAGGRLFPALDADITLRPHGAGGCLLALDGAYRPPLAGLGARLDRALLHRVADATVRAVLRDVAGALSAAEVPRRPEPPG